MDYTRIAVLGHAGELGGAQRAFKELVAFFERSCYIRVATVCLDSGTVSSERSRLPSQIASIPFDRGLKKLPSTMLAVARVRAFKPDIFVSIGLARSASLIGRFAGPSVRRIAYDFVADRSPDCALLKDAFRSFDDIFVQSPSMKNRLVGFGFPAERIFSVPCFSGADFPDLTKKSACPGASLIKLAYFGRLVPHKGLPELIEALSLFEFRHSVRLDIWGDGPDRARINQAITNREMSEKVTVRGLYPDGREAKELMSTYDALVVPSLCNEGVPLVLIEGMSVGLPALCTAVGAIPDVCECNPDFVMCKPDIPGLLEGLKTLEDGLIAGTFSSARLRSLFESSFSSVAVGTLWSEHLGLSHVAEGR